jgi:hypothetical protein
MRAFYLVCALALVVGCGGDEPGAPGGKDGSGAGDGAPSDRSMSGETGMLDAAPDTEREVGDSASTEVGPVDGDAVDLDVGRPLDAGDAARSDVGDAGHAVEAGDSIDGRGDVGDATDTPDRRVCVGGTVDCDGDGMCEELESSPAHCGRCGHSCLGGACLASQCQPFPIATSLNSPIGVAVVATDVYVTEFQGNVTSGPNTGSLIRIAPDRTVTAIETGLNYPAALWFDELTDSFSISDYFGYRFVARPLHEDGGVVVHRDAGGTSTLISNDVAFPFGITGNTNWLFVVSVGAVVPIGEQTIQRRSRSDLTTYTYFSEFPRGPTHLDIDANYIYWAEEHNGRVVRRSIDATPDAGPDGIEVIAEGQASPRGIAVDGSVVYFSLYGTPDVEGGANFGAVMRVDKTPGSTPVKLVALPGYVEDVAIDATAIYIVGRGTGIIWKLAK